MDEARRAPQRLAAVVRSGLLDSAPEPSFDALTRMAALLLKVPASFVSIVDAERDFYKSQIGLPADLAAARALTGVTFCHHTLGRRNALVIGDTHADPAWRAVPTVDRLGVRAYVGVPIELDGQTVGSFCVIDQQPRAWSDEELGILEQLALSAGREISLRVALADARDASAHARELARSREEVIAVVAHDLSTPVQVMSLSVETLRRTNAASPEVLTRMSRATGSMKRMVADLLATHAASSAARHTPIGAARLLADVADTMGPIAERAGVPLVLAAPAGDAADATVSVDYAQMLRVLCNIVGNAIKFSPLDANVTLGIERDGPRVHLRVADAGCGIDAQELARVFDRGWQGERGLERGDGSGLGLAIVKDLVQAHGGEVHITSAPGKGTTVCVSLPCERGAPAHR
jgi:signal transduction histidine kinase